MVITMVVGFALISALFLFNWRTLQNDTAPTGVALPRLLQLALQPVRFFRAGVPSLPIYALLLLSWGMGVLKVMDFTDAQILKKNIGLEFNLLESVWNAWLPYWIWVAGVGVLAAGVVWFIGFWWYKKRLQWSGAAASSPMQLRRVYVLSEAWLLIIVVGYMALNTLRYDNPNAAWIGEHGAATVIINLAYFYSLVISYFAVSTSFPVRRGRALFWFFVFPLLPCYFDLLSIVARMH